MNPYYYQFHAYYQLNKPLINNHASTIQFYPSKSYNMHYYASNMQEHAINNHDDHDEWMRMD